MIPIDYFRRLLTRPCPPCDGGEESGTRFSLRFLGTAGFTVESAQRAIVLDPYISRAGIFTSLFGRLPVDEALLQHWIPRADDVLVGHAHYDHVLDAPDLCRRTGATLHGSSAVAHVARAAGLDGSRVRVVRPGQAQVLGPFGVTAFPSRHGKVYGRVPLPGDIVAPPPWPPRIWDLRHGDVLHWLLDVEGVRVLHVDSADFIDEAVPRADIVLLCAIGRHYRRDYTRRLCELARPSVVIPCHWDDFTLPLDAPPRQLPGVDVEEFVSEIRAAGARAVVLAPGQSWRPR